MQFLITGMMIILMAFLSCGSGIIGTLAATVLPLVAVVGVALMTLQFWSGMLGGAPNRLAGNGVPGLDLEGRAVFANFMNGVLNYGGRFLHGMVSMTGRMIAWALPRDLRREQNLIEPNAVPQAPPEPPFEQAPGARAAPAIPRGAPLPAQAPILATPGGSTVIHIHIHTETSHKPRRFSASKA